MTVTDFELAWGLLGEYIASKPQHGREGTLVKMQEIAAQARVPAGELSRLLRLYGVEVERTRRVSESDEGGDFAAGGPSVVDASLPAHHEPEEGHDGSRHTAAAAVG